MRARAFEFARYAPARRPRKPRAPLKRLADADYIHAIQPPASRRLPLIQRPDRRQARSTYTRALTLCLTAVALLTACGDPTGPSARRTSIAVLAGDAQFGAPGAGLEALQVVVTDAITRAPRDGVTVTWQVTAGEAILTPVTTTTNSRGIASTTPRLPGSLGASTIRATADGQVGDPAMFTVAAVSTPVIAGVSPASARAGDTLAITGSNFGTSTSAVAVRFDGVRGTVLSATPERVVVVVPPCVATRAAAVVVSLGTVASTAATVNTVATGASPLRLARGQVRVFTEPVDLRCVRLPPDPAGASYLIIPQNVTETYSITMSFELAALGVIPVVASPAPAMAGSTFASDWELALRAKERALTAGMSPDAFAPTASIRAAQDLPNVGDRRTFNTLNAQSKTVKITAEVRAITTRAILYQDIAADNVFTAADYQRFGGVFDEPIFGTVVAAFGQGGDIDDNDRIIMVFTPQVNALTAKGTGSYIAGYFYACDLLARSRCDASNGGEIFYSMVPDPTGKFSDPHSATNVMRTVPPVLAHEFVHMINYHARGSQEVLWLGEALAHTAEDVVGQVFLDRGDAVTAAEFQAQNHSHARLFLANAARTSLIADESPGTIELRGAGWLFLRYLRGLHGENALLRALTSGPESGSRNITTRTGKTWSSLLADFAVAIYADDAPTLTGVPLEPRHTFVNANLRSLLGPPAAFPLAVRTLGFGDFLATGDLPSSAWQYNYVQVPAAGTTTSLNLVFSGPRGGPFSAAAVPQLTILRVR